MLFIYPPCPLLSLIFDPRSLSALSPPPNLSALSFSSLSLSLSPGERVEKDRERKQRDREGESIERSRGDWRMREEKREIRGRAYMCLERENHRLEIGMPPDADYPWIFESESASNPYTDILFSHPSIFVSVSEFES